MKRRHSFEKYLTYHIIILFIVNLFLIVLDIF